MRPQCVGCGKAADNRLMSDSDNPRPGAVSAKWGDLGPRVASALVLIPTALAAIWRGGAPFAAFVALITIGLAVEWLGMCGWRRRVRAGLPFVAVPVAVLLPLSGNTLVALTVLAVAGILALVDIPRHSPACCATSGAVTSDLPGSDPPASNRIASGPGAFAFVALGIPYVGLPGVALVWMRGLPRVGLVNVLVLLLVVWASDIGAYFVGRLIGGPLLAPAISPGKTWSGAVGGMLAAASIGFGAALTLGDGRGWRACGTAVLIGVAAQIGDLLESRFKRFFGVKDSGSLIPGHGGLLDRLDAVLAAAPTAALLALTLPSGVSLWE